MNLSKVRGQNVPSLTDVTNVHGDHIAACVPVLVDMDDPLHRPPGGGGRGHRRTQQRRLVGAGHAVSYNQSISVV